MFHFKALLLHPLPPIPHHHQLSPSKIAIQTFLHSRPRVVLTGGVFPLGLSCIMIRPDSQWKIGEENPRGVKRKTLAEPSGNNGSGLSKCPSFLLALHCMLAPPPHDACLPKCQWMNYNWVGKIPVASKKVKSGVRRAKDLFVCVKFPFLKDQWRSVRLQFWYLPSRRIRWAHDVNAVPERKPRLPEKNPQSRLHWQPKSTVYVGRQARATRPGGPERFQSSWRLRPSSVGEFERECFSLCSAPVNNASCSCTIWEGSSSAILI